MADQPADTAHQKSPPCVAVLPARGGSKRIPFKNGRDFSGAPMISWPVNAARKSALFDRIVVSTDSPEIAAIVQSHGGEVPFLRDAGLADDHTGTTEVIRDAVGRLNLPAEAIVCCIYPTAVMLEPDDLRAGLAQLRESNTDWVLSVGHHRSAIQRAYRMTAGVLTPFDRAMMEQRSQDLEPAYFDAGQFYFARAATWANPDARVWDSAAPVILPADRCVDIDTEEDWHLAEKIFASQQKTPWPMP